MPPPARRRWWPPIPDEADPTHHHLTPLIRLAAAISRLLVQAVFRVRREGLDRLPPTGPVILAPNHASNADPVLIGAFFTTRLGRRIHWFSKQEVLEWPVVGWIGRAGGIHGIERGAADVAGFRTAMRVLESGGVLLVFPEGTRSPTGELQAAKDGLATLAQRSGATIVPIGIAGTHHAWPKGGRPRFGRRVAVRVGTPFRVEDIVPPDVDRRSVKARTTRAVMRRIADLLPPEQRGAYARDEAAPVPDDGPNDAPVR